MKVRSAESMGRRGAVWQLGLGLATLAASCRRPPPEPLIKAGMYGDSPQELERLWRDILAACRSDDRNRVHDLMVAFIMTQAELQSLLGPVKASELWPRYQAMMGSLCNAGAVELVAHVYEKKYDDVAVARIDTLIEAAGPAATGAGAAASGLLDTDVAVHKALVSPTPFYTVRLKKKTETKGLRYDFFVYRNGFWRSGNLLGKFLMPTPPLPGPGPGSPGATGSATPAGPAAPAAAATDAAAGGGTAAAAAPTKSPTERP